MWPKWIFGLLLGYTVLNKSFAYFGIPSLKLFIGEATLAAFVLLRPREVYDRWLMGLIRNGVLTQFCWALILFFGYGVFELIRGITIGYPPVIALQNFVFNYYPVYFFAGLSVGLQRPSFLERYFKILAWCSGIYGVAYVLVLFRLSQFVWPWSGLPVFGQAGGGGAVLLAALCLNWDPLRRWLPLLLNAFVMLGLQVRGEWIGVAAGVVVWSLAMNRLERAFKFAVPVIALLAFAYFFDVHISGPRGSIAAGDMIARGVAPFSSELAEEISPSGAAYAGTATWRSDWWRAIWASVHSENTWLVIGHGYGYPLSFLVSYIRDPMIRTPHNVFFYALGYTGWVGVFLFGLLQLSIGLLMWRVFQVTRQPIGIVSWTATIVGALPSNVFETPFGAIPFYLMMGICAAPLVQMELNLYSASRNSHVLSPVLRQGGLHDSPAEYSDSGG